MAVAVVFFAVTFVAAAVVFFAGVAFLAVAFFAAAFLAADFLAAAAFTVVRAAEDPPERLPLGAFLTATSFLGSFFEPLTRSLKP
ncbi:hypothetical protein EES46_12435 [Streptomyces sp. ADI98-10]|nr:hypothetical protein EES46_12435 [Streptomyces sp. ADI98-10]